tara:strand:+ start:1245 stop:1373 length:129 start_codon:yes stop_codon:yes gene_type:complete
MLDRLIRCLVSIKEKQVKKQNLKLKVERNIKNKIKKIEKILK